jgi:hypothetical protein
VATKAAIAPEGDGTVPSLLGGDRTTAAAVRVQGESRGGIVSTYYDREGNPITMEAWCVLLGRKHSEEEYGRVAITVIDDSSISTVWLGLNHNWRGNPPLIFETMVFGGPLNGQQWRYSSEAQALAGHDQVVAEVRHARIIQGLGS